jgi:hypothetical protein
VKCDSRRKRDRDNRAGHLRLAWLGLDMNIYMTISVLIEIQQGLLATFGQIVHMMAGTTMRKV